MGLEQNDDPVVTGAFFSGHWKPQHPASQGKHLGLFCGVPPGVSKKHLEAEVEDQARREVGCHKDLCGDGAVVCLVLVAIPSHTSDTMGQKHTFRGNCM